MRDMMMTLMILGVAVAAAGCTSTAPRNVDREFGNSVRQLVSSQTLDPAASANPAPDAPDSGDGDRLNNVLESYRGDVAEPEDVGQPIVISVGGR